MYGIVNNVNTETAMYTMYIVSTLLCHGTQF